MTNYSLQIRDHNIPAHLDIEKEVQDRQNGLFTFTLRVNNGNIVDFNVTEYVNVKQKYGVVKALVIEEFAVTLSGGERSASDTIRPDHI